MTDNVDGVASSTVEAQFGKEIAKKIQALAPGEPFMVARHIPRCPNCRAPNPTMMSACPSCGAPAPATTPHFERAVRTGGGLRGLLRRLLGSRE